MKLNLNSHALNPILRFGRVRDILAVLLVAGIACAQPDPEHIRVNRENFPAANPESIQAILIRDGDLYIAAIPDGEPRLLVDHEAITADPDHFCLVCNGSKLFYSIEKLVTLETEEERDYFMLDLKSGDLEFLFAPGFDHFWRLPSPDGKSLAVLPGDDASIGGTPWIETIHGEIEEQPTDNVDNYMWGVEMAWSPDSKRVYVLKPEHNLMYFVDSTMRGTDLHPGLPQGYEAQALWAERDGTVIGIGSESASSHPRGHRKWQAIVVNPDSTAAQFALPEGTWCSIHPKLGTSEFWMISSEAAHVVDWKSKRAKSVSEPNGMSHYHSPVWVVSHQGRDHFLIQNLTMPEGRDFRLGLVAEIIWNAVGDTESRVIFPGYRIAEVLPE